MTEITIGFIYFEEDTIDTTKELEKMIQLFNNNFLIYYQFLYNYCFFSDYEISKEEVRILIKIIESEEGFNQFYNNGIETEFARYIPLKNSIEEFEKIEEESNFDEKLDKFIRNVEKANTFYQINNIIEKDKTNEIKIKEDEELIIKSRELILMYKKMLKEKDDKIKELNDDNISIYEKYKKIPKILRKIFIKEPKMLNQR